MSTTARIKQLETERDKLIKRIAGIETEINAYNSLPPAELLTMRLHDRLCRHNHTDGCDWFCHYENCLPDGNAFAYKEYYRKAEALLLLTSGDVDYINKILDIL